MTEPRALKPTKPLSLTMARAYRACRDAGGLWRWPGGWWVATPPPDVKKITTPANNVETWNAQTVYALLDRDMIEFTERAGERQFPVKATAK